MKVKLNGQVTKTKSDENRSGDKMSYNESSQTITLNYVYPYDIAYDIDLARIKTERDLMAWTCHLCEKSWMTIGRIRSFVLAVSEIKGFNPYGL